MSIWDTRYLNFIYITSNHNIQTSYEDIAILSCHGLRKYWISWDNGLVATGLGSYPENKILDWTDPSPFQIVTFSVGMDRTRNPSLPTRDGEWSFPKSLGNYDN
jgi:hypothetical protein